MNRHIKRLPLAAGAIFLINAVICVSRAWISGEHRFDLGISFSGYVGMTRAMSVMYFVSALIMIPLLAVYIAKTKLPVIKRVVYAAVFFGISGAAFFPFNTYSENPTAVTIDLHNCFAEGLMVAVTVSFILSAALTKHRGQRIAALLSLVYAVVFVILFCMGFNPLFAAFFIWENLFIFLLLLGLHMEQYGAEQE